MLFLPKYLKRMLKHVSLAFRSITMYTSAYEQIPRLTSFDCSSLALPDHMTANNSHRYQHNFFDLGLWYNFFWSQRNVRQCTHHVKAPFLARLKPIWSCHWPFLPFARYNLATYMITTLFKTRKIFVLYILAIVLHYIYNYLPSVLYMYIPRFILNTMQIVLWSDMYLHCICVSEF